tara:strand:+ start:3121 stop:3360 length:240 start_codon:yes stop_codon:yes gene_type:complete
MAIDYAALLTDERKRNILEQRVSQFASEAYQHSLNKTTCESLEDTEGVANADKALVILEAAIATHQTELAALPAAPVAE